MRIIVLCLDNSYGPWNELYSRGALNTWCKVGENLTTIRLYRGRKPRYLLIHKIQNRIMLSRFFVKKWKYLREKKDFKKINCYEKDNNILVDIPELWPNITTKTIAAINFIESNFDYDFIIRATASCYINMKVLVRFLKGIDSDSIYAGPLKGNFVSGWGIVMSKKAATILIKNINHSELDLFDDEAIGLVFRRIGINPIGIPFIQFDSLKQLTELDIATSNSIPLYRLKSKVNNVRIDYQLMNRLHTLVENQKIT